MKKAFSFILIAVMAMTMMMLTSCGSEFGCSDNNEKQINITAKKAGKGMFFTTGALIVSENEEIEIESDLKSGSVTIEFFSAEGMEDIEEVPDLDDMEPVFTANVSGEESQTLGFGTGTFLVKATVTEKATGTIEIEVENVDD